MEKRLNKILAEAGLCSRRGAEAMILAGRVAVNGRAVGEPGAKADPERDAITLDGQPVNPGHEQRAYYLFYKPYGYITTLSDPQGRPTITEFTEKLGQRVYPVGRLDYDSEGLLILTNDGELAMRLMHPRHHVPKTYRVKVSGVPDDMALARLAGGVLMIGDKPAKTAQVELIKKAPDRAWLSFTLTEGRRRQVKRMCSAVGHPVLKLKRTHFGPLSLGRLGPGEIRPLAAGEVRALKESAGLVSKTAQEDRPAPLPRRRKVR